MLRRNASCEVKGTLRTCGAGAHAQCVYCARAFCLRHGEVYEDGYEVCSRKVCVAKQENLRVHLVYKEAVLNRNLQRLCGLEICQAEIQVQCNRCRGYFCVSHTRPWLETVTEKPERTCNHCLDRRAIWERE